MLLGSATAADDKWKAVAKASVSLFFELPCYAASRGHVGMCMAVAEAWDNMYKDLQPEMAEEVGPCVAQHVPGFGSSFDSVDCHRV